MNTKVAFETSPELFTRSRREYFWRIYARHRPLATTICLLIGIALVWFGGWEVQIIGGAFVIAGAIGIVVWTKTYFSFMRTISDQIALLEFGKIAINFNEERIDVTDATGTHSCEWSKLTRVASGRRFIFFLRNQTLFFSLPIDKVTHDVRQLIREKMDT